MRQLKHRNILKISYCICPHLSFQSWGHNSVLPAENFGHLNVKETFLIICIVIRTALHTRRAIHLEWLNK